MKILVLANNDVGLYQFRRELLSEMIGRGNEVYISLPDGELVMPLCEMGCHFIDTPIDRRGINPATDLKLFSAYRRLLREIKPDLVVTYTIKPNIYGGLACRMKKVPYAANITGLGTAFQKKGALRTLVTLMYRTALKKGKTVFFENAGNMQTLLDEGIVRREQCCLLSGAGVNLDHYQPAEYPTDDSPVRFLFIGRVMREKGIDELFGAMERLHSEKIPCVLDVLGYYEEDYAEAIERYTAAGWLRYHGYQKDVRPFIVDSHCFVLPSWHEGMANTNLECAAMARPLITSNIHGCKEAVMDGESGFLCEPKNADSLYEAMKRFSALPVDRREQMGIRGRQHMEQTFDKKIVVGNTLKELGV